MPAPGDLIPVELRTVSLNLSKSLNRCKRLKNPGLLNIFWKNSREPLKNLMMDFDEGCR
jgi:hypothetical protein